MDLPAITKISISYKCYGSSTCSYTVEPQRVIVQHKKQDPADVDSYVELHSITVNNICFGEIHLRSGLFFPDLTIHPDAPEQITPCTVFGYCGSFIFDLDKDIEFTKVKLDSRYHDSDYKDYQLWKSICRITN